MKNTLINNELLEEIRTSKNTSKWHNIDDNKIKIMWDKFFDPKHRLREVQR